MSPEDHKTFASQAQRYLIAGILTAIPIWITWLVFKFVFTQLSKFGMPWVRALAKTLQQYAPSLAEWLLQPWFQSVLAIVVTVMALYLLGWTASRVIGSRMIALFDRLVERIPLVQTIYGGTKKLVAALQQKPERVHRVVLIEFPSSEMKAVGFVTRVMKDADTGQDLAAVYVPTTPNPTSGYLEIVPLERLISTTWTIDEAMSFIISGGTVAPDRLHYSQSAPSPPTTEAERTP